jgi:hypothetical protein
MALAGTVRRFLEHFGDDLDRVVLVVDSQEDESIYEAVLPLYFPRSDGEERRSSVALAGRDLGASAHGMLLKQMTGC